MNIRNAKYKNEEKTIVDVEIEHPKYGWIPYTFKDDEIDESFDTEVREWLKTNTPSSYVEIVIPITNYKTSKIQELLSYQKTEVEALLGTVATGEVESFTIQEKEARAWNVDNSVSTPFIDVLLNARSLEGETKQDLVDLIILKADAYAASYATILGKFHRLVKEVEACATVEEVEAIGW